MIGINRNQSEYYLLWKYGRNTTYVLSRYITGLLAERDIPFKFTYMLRPYTTLNDKTAAQPRFGSRISSLRISYTCACSLVCIRNSERGNPRSKSGFTRSLVVSVATLRMQLQPVFHCSLLAALDPSICHDTGAWHGHFTPES